jgi:hypothetical protein
MGESEALMLGSIGFRVLVCMFSGIGGRRKVITLYVSRDRQPDPHFLWILNGFCQANGDKLR